MTAGPSLRCLLHRVQVTIACTAPPYPPPEHRGRSGGRWRWWISAGWGRRGWSRRSGYLPIEGAPTDRDGDTDASWTIELAAGGEYTLGIGEARYPLRIPADAAGPVSVRVDPLSLSDARVTIEHDGRITEYFADDSDPDYVAPVDAPF